MSTSGLPERISSKPASTLPRRLPVPYLTTGPCLNLYKLSVREELYVESQEHFVNLTNEPNVDGVFELQVRTFAC
jgi:hypothetical protein